MRIAISGTANTGKSTLVKNILTVWPNYTTPEKTYRDVLKEKNLSHSSNTSAETQWEILNFMVDQMQQTTKDSKIVFDRCPLDNLAYTLWAHSKNIEGFDKQFVDKCITIVKESMRSLDIIFLLSYDESIKVVDDGVRDIDVDYLKEIDNIFNALYEQYAQNYDADIFFPKNDSPGIIKLPTSIKQRVDTISEYLDSTGSLYGDEHSIFNPEKLDELEALVRQQKAALDEEQKEKELWKKFGLNR